MSSVVKTASTKLDWAKIITTLGLTGQTSASLTSFKKRNDEAKKEYISLTEQSTEVDFAHYRSVLKNSKVIDEVEKAVQSFKPITYDVSKTIKTIDLFEQKAIENAKLTAKSVTEEIKQLEETLKDIEGARPFDQLTVEDVSSARPDLNEKVTYMVKNGKWNVPGYKEKFGDLTVM
ncbi:ATP synthase subunit d, mitochondrial [[Candida] railenensis]|uniref:ATP synthase subunit d, mitochondrial n=1 Tax=[Candida] railenensis TaxID=45579 RepID=A0A9P0QUB6_9ASCO|nr:ATP synthase subunit d, mitochondrial [[Candida] railenensis]